MLDWGMLRLEQALKKESGLEKNLSVTFDWDRNLIVVSTHRFSSGEDNFEVERLCKAWINDKRIEAGVLPIGEVYPRLQFSYFVRYFSHIGFNRTIEGVDEDEALKELDKKLFLQFDSWIRDSEGTGYSADLRCTGYLLSNRYSFEKLN